jgi:acyl-CoA thioester hydrolase
MSEFVHRIEVRFRDCDPMGHANNAVYFTYLEQTRLAHWRSFGGLMPRPSSPGAGAGHDPASRSDLPGVILAHAECDYLRPVRYGEAIDVKLRVVDLGRTSFRYEYEIVDEQQRTIARAKTVQVMYDYAAGKPVPIPDGVRARLSGASRL